MKINLLNVVVFAEDYEKMVEWYKDAFDLKIVHQDSGEYHYTELGKEGQVIVGITPAIEMEHNPTTPRNNTTIMQLDVSDIETLFKNVSDQGGKILFGPSKEEGNNFYYGGLTDIEGNQIWVVQMGA